VSQQIRVVLAEDQAMVLGALAALLEIEKDIKVVARARNGREAMTLVAQHQPDVLISDIEMPEMNGLTLAAEIHGQYPRVHIIILTTFARSGYLRRAMDAGAQGYMLKDRPSAELADCVRRVCRGLRVVDPELAAAVWSEEQDPLSERERQILWRAGEGKSGAEIAAELHLSEGTVRNYLSDAIAKLGASNRVDAARLARSRGWL
jgi:two-component system response regulator DesR